MGLPLNAGFPWIDKIIQVGVDNWLTKSVLYQTSLATALNYRLTEGMKLGNHISFSKPYIHMCTRNSVLHGIRKVLLWHEDNLWQEVIFSVYSSPWNCLCTSKGRSVNLPTFLQNNWCSSFEDRLWDFSPSFPNIFLLNWELGRIIFYSYKYADTEKSHFCSLFQVSIFVLCILADFQVPCTLWLH